MTTVEVTSGDDAEIVETPSSGPAAGNVRVARTVQYVLLYVGCLAAAFVLLAVFVHVATDAGIVDVFDALYNGSVGSLEALGLTLNETMPLLIVGLGGVIALRAGLINLGMEGQLAIGGVFAALAVFELGLPPAAAIPAMLVASAIGGGLWAGIASLMRFFRNVDVIVSTLLLNFVALEIVSFAVNKPWLLQATSSNNLMLAQSDLLAESARIPAIGSVPGFSMSTGVILALVLAVWVSFALGRTKWGFHLKMIGLNPTAAKAAGVSIVAVGGFSLVLSGAVAGVAGGVLFGATTYRIQPGFSNWIGYYGLLIALIARRAAWIVVPIALLFGALRTGATNLAARGVPRYFVDIIQTMVVIAVLVPPALMILLDRRRALAEARSTGERREVGATQIGATP